MLPGFGQVCGASGGRPQRNDRSRNRRKASEGSSDPEPTIRKNRMPVRAPVTEPAAGDLRIASPTAKTLGAKCFLREDHALVRVGSTFGSAPFALRGILRLRGIGNRRAPSCLPPSLVPSSCFLLRSFLPDPPPVRVEPFGRLRMNCRYSIVSRDMLPPHPDCARCERSGMGAEMAAPHTCHLPPATRAGLVPPA